MQEFHSRGMHSGQLAKKKWPATPDESWALALERRDHPGHIGGDVHPEP